MTRNKPWTGDVAMLRSSASQAALQQDVQTAHQPLSAALQSAEPQPSKQVLELPAQDGLNDIDTDTSLKTQTYEPPQVDDDTEETLHLNHPDAETKAQVDAEDQHATMSSAKSAAQEQAGHCYHSDTDSEDNGGDLLETLGDFLSGGTTGRHARPSNPFGFLDFIGETLAAPFLAGQHQQESHNNASQPRTVPSDDLKRLGNFHKSSSEVKLEDGHILVAKCRDVAGAWQSSQIDLDECLMNDNGCFKWSATEGGFSHTARGIRLHSGGEMLHAELQACNGRWKAARIKLSKVIMNGNGQLALIPVHQW